MSGVKDEYSVEEFSTRLPIQRSMIAFARGARIGVLMICIPSLTKTASNMLVNFESRSRIKNLNCATRSPRSISRLRACWQTQSAVGCAVTPRTCTRRLACSTTVKQYRRVSSTVSQWKKSQARIPCAWPPRNSVPGWTGASRGRIDSSAFQDRPDRGGADLTAHAGEFTGDASVAPARVLGRHAHNHPAQRRGCGWTSAPLALAGPSSSDQLGMPAQKSTRVTNRWRRPALDSSRASALMRARSAQSAEGVQPADARRTPDGAAPGSPQSWMPPIA